MSGSNGYDYEGHDIGIREMPQGCFITQVGPTGQTVEISHPDDAWAVINSLQEMLRQMMIDGDENNGNKTSEED